MAQSRKHSESFTIAVSHAPASCHPNFACASQIFATPSTVETGGRPAAIFRSVERWATAGPGQRVDVAPDLAAAVRDRLAGVLFSQAVDVLDRGIGAPADLDLGCRVALGFKRGPLELMRACGDTETARILQRFAEERPGMPMPTVHGRPTKPSAAATRSARASMVPS